MTYHVLLFICLKTRRVYLGGISDQPDSAWLQQVAHNVSMDDFGCVKPGDRLLHDRDGKYMWSGFRYKLQSAGIQCLPLPPRSPNMNAFAERFVRFVKEECTSHFIFISRRHVERVLSEYFAFYNTERPHQGKVIGGELLTQHRIRLR